MKKEIDLLIEQIVFLLDSIMFFIALNLRLRLRKITLRSCTCFFICYIVRP